MGSETALIGRRANGSVVDALTTRLEALLQQLLEWMPGREAGAWRNWLAGLRGFLLAPATGETSAGGNVSADTLLSNGDVAGAEPDLGDTANNRLSDVLPRGEMDGLVAGLYEASDGSAGSAIMGNGVTTAPGLVSSNGFLSGSFAQSIDALVSAMAGFGTTPCAVTTDLRVRAAEQAMTGLTASAGEAFGRPGHG